MKISSVRSFLLSYPFAEAIKLPFYGGERTILKRDAMLIRIDLDNGLVGYAPGAGSEHAQQEIETKIGPFLTGRTLGDPEPYWRVCVDNNTRNPAELTARPGQMLRVPVPQPEV